MVEHLIDHLGARGDGVVAGESPIYVPFAAPGDRVRIDDDGAEIIAFGPHHHPPRCAHYQVCGGCVLQHIDDGLYARWLADRIGFALAQHDLATEILPPTLSPSHSRRRVAMQARWQGDRLVLGFSGRRSHDLVDIGDCPLLVPRLSALLAPLRVLLSRHLPRKRAARIEMFESDAGVDLLLTGIEAEGAKARQTLADFADAQNLARLSLSAGSEVEILAERRPPQIRLGKALVAPPPGGFLQATREGEAALIAAVRDGVGGAKSVADLFAGVGTFSFSLADAIGVHAVEGARPALLALEAARRGLVGTKPVTTEHRDLFRRPLNPDELARFDAVVFDPPRAGAVAQAQALAQSKVRRVVAVSCNPNSFGRDARLLVDGGYHLSWVKPVGQFLWSAEVELVACFSR